MALEKTVKTSSSSETQPNAIAPALAMTNFVLQPWHLLVTVLAGVMNQPRFHERLIQSVAG
jgi:hypothetical protein